ncbi:MAG: hypothetical protein K2V38_14415 [Gemmataceae bacterium]|nr:hypothetical protein [Gemmataceae bacterium]
MPNRPSKNVVQKVIEFPLEFAAEVEAFARGRRETFKSVVLRALRRHLDSPPPILPDPPLPPVEPAPQVPSNPPKKRGAKPKGVGTAETEPG